MLYKFLSWYGTIIGEVAILDNQRCFLTSLIVGLSNGFFINIVLIKSFAPGEKKFGNDMLSNNILCFMPFIFIPL